VSKYCFRSGCNYPEGECDGTCLGDCLQGKPTPEQSAVKQFEEQCHRFYESIKAVVREEIQKERRPGGIL